MTTRSFAQLSALMNDAALNDRFLEWARQRGWTRVENKDRWEPPVRKKIGPQRQSDLFEMFLSDIKY